MQVNFHEELTELNLPNWMKILQLEIPFELNEKNEFEILKLIEKNKDIECLDSLIYLKKKS